MLYCPNFFWNVLQVWMTGNDVYLQMTWSWPDKTWNILCSYCLQWNTSQSKFRNHYFLFLFAFSILSQLFMIWGCIYIYILYCIFILEYLGFDYEKRFDYVWVLSYSIIQIKSRCVLLTNQICCCRLQRTLRDVISVRHEAWACRKREFMSFSKTLKILKFQGRAWEILDRINVQDLVREFISVTPEPKATFGVPKSS